ncbi:MAG: extracellular solute-binding protein [Anaerocolumna sp.]
MRKFRKTVSLLCVSAIVLSLLSGCSRKEDSSSAEGTIKIFNRVNPEVVVDNNPIIKALGEKVNVSIEYDAPPINNYNEKLQIAMASGDIPDIIYNWGGSDQNYEQWAKDGLLAELDDKIANYPNIMETVPKEYWEAIRSTQTGKIHSIPRTNVDNYWGFVINQKWLDNLGLSAPNTLDELKDVLHQFTFNDPDGNGVKDTYGFSFNLASGEPISIMPLKFAFGLERVKDTDGQYKIKEKMSGYIPYLTYIKELYEDGSLDPEFITNSLEATREKLASDRVGVLQDHQVGVMTLLKVQSDAIDRYSYIGAPKQANGERVEYIEPSMWGTWMISADADVDKCLELIDYAMSDEGFALNSLGIEGEHYNSYDYENRMVDRTEEQSNKVLGVTSSYFTFAYAKDGASAIIENASTQERIDKYFQDFDNMKSDMTEVHVPFVKAPLYTTFKSDNPDVITKLSEMEVQYIVGEIELEKIEEFLNDVYFPAAKEMEEEYIAWMIEYENKMK